MVNVNPAYRLGELEFALTKVGCVALILADRFKILGLPRHDRDAGAGTRRRRARRGCGPRGCRRCAPSIRMGAAALAGHAELRRRGGDGGRPGRLARATAALDPDDPINIQFTSGTTGLPKGATLTHRNIVNNAHFVTRRRCTSAPRTGSASRCRSTTASAW